MIDLAHLFELAKDNFSPVQWIFGGAIGFLATRWTLTKKERLDAEQKLFENGRDLMLAQNARYQEFTTVFQKYISKKDDPTFDDFLSIATAGDNYFHQLAIISNAILAAKVDKQSRDATLVPSIERAIKSNLPGYYSTLQSIAARKGYEYHGKLERAKYTALYAVVEKYGRIETLEENDVTTAG
ncbi:hypothetical protein ACNJX9_33995 [Bradyrhizobium sp. DASA03076]|uniref:hypothetical protein n=1 Tax=Bradyrhizobium sp. BLXBL-03 TaxID=3395916 RepID=UPI003F6F406D